MRKNDFTSTLYITDIGYYPKAKFHYRERPNGADQNILIYCIEGEGWAQVDESEYAIKPGDFFIVPRNLAHKYAANENDPWTIYWIHFKGSLSAATVNITIRQLESHKGFVHYNEERINLFNNMYSQLERGYGIENLIYVHELRVFFLATFIFQEKYNTTNKFSKYDATDISYKLYEQKINQIISLEEIAKTVNLSPSHFSNLLKRKQDFLLLNISITLKIQKSCQYLLFTGLRE